MNENRSRGDQRDRSFFKEISFELKEGGKVEIKFLGKALTKETILELEKALEICENDSDVSKVALTGEGKYFCLGGDIRRFVEAGEDLPKLIDEMASALARVVIKIASLTKPVIAKVNGIAAGAGLSIVSAADHAVALKQASFVSGYSKIGLSPDGGLTYTLPEKLRRKMGDEADKVVGAVVDGNELVSAEQSKEIGLVDEVVDEEAEMNQWVDSGKADTKLRFDRVALEEKMREELVEMIRRAGLPETRDKMRSFLEKR